MRYTESMKTLVLIGILATGVYVGFTNLPEPMKADTKSRLAALNLSLPDTSKLLPPLKAKVEPLKAKIIPQSSVQKREALIQKLESSVKTVAAAEANPSRTQKEKEAVNAAIKDAQALIEELKAENQNSSFVTSVIERVTNTVAPATKCPAP